MTKSTLLDDDVREFLEKNKLHPRESFNGVLKRLLKLDKKNNLKKRTEK